MARHFSSSRTDADELWFLTAVYEDVCQRVSDEGAIPLTTQICETIANSIATMADSGERDPERLCNRAMREVEAYDGAKPTAWTSTAGKSALFPFLFGRDWQSEIKPGTVR